ncbi:hypothetical protein DBR40_20215 [Pedobacter sp. KBW01]|uniref:hypothetical protein n=1 Tax=Pedobacter sp. KBW01 TaxID=2153364 RepID=UPI000F591120|nr:hypothetical protein [Pedobacter sp. KBW01]RQO68567.1 hypothetical protein DBR40_20215 [Pedobacter sp. KBW01]
MSPYTSANEYSFFRGAAATINLYKYFDITPFVSFRHLDASQKENKLGEPEQSTINQTGLHRTPTEIKNKNSLTQRTYSLVLQYTKNEFGVGTVAYQSSYDNSFITQTALYDKYSFMGNKLTNLD